MGSIDNKDDGSKESRSKLRFTKLSIIVSLITLCVTIILTIYTLNYNKKTAIELEILKNDLLYSSNVEFEINDFFLAHSYNGSREGTAEFLNTSKYKATNIEICIALVDVNNLPWEEVISSISDIRITTYPASLNPVITEANVGTSTRTMGQGYDTINNAYMIHLDYIPPNSAIRIELKKPDAEDSIDSCSVQSKFIIKSRDLSLLSPPILMDVILSTLESHFKVATLFLSVNSENSLDVEEGWTNLFSFSWFPAAFDISSKRNGNTWEQTIGYSLHFPKGSEMQEVPIYFDIEIEPDYESEKGYRFLSLGTNR